MKTDSNQLIRVAGDASKRSGWVTGVVVIQALWMVALVALPVYLLILARSSGILNGPDGKDAAHGLRVGAAVIASPALFATASSYGLWKGKLWGWWVALLSNTAILGILTYSMMDENTIDWEMAGVTAVSAVLPVLLLLPVVRKFYRQASESA
jgi:hypothetical protein